MMFKRKKHEAEPTTVDLEIAFGAELRSRIVGHLGEQEAMQLAREMMAEAKSRWTVDLLSEEEKEQVRRDTEAAGAYLIEDRARFYAEAVARKVAESVVPEAMADAGLPADMEPELTLQLAALLFAGLDVER